MFEKMKERAAAAQAESQQRLQATMDPGETMIEMVMASSAATKDTRVMGRSAMGLVAKTVTNAVNGQRFIDGPVGSVARRFPDDNPFTVLVVSNQRLRLMGMLGEGIGKAMSVGNEIMRVERAEIVSTAQHSKGRTTLNFADGSFIVLASTPHRDLPDLNEVLAKMGVPQAI